MNSAAIISDNLVGSIRGGHENSFAHRYKVRGHKISIDLCVPEWPKLPWMIAINRDRNEISALCCEYKTCWRSLLE
jgi:hypothetical protein